MNFTKAFTLAEVLITLGIIGIVAAMTLPTIFNACQKRQYLARLKRSYSILNQAVQLSEEENGGVGSWDTSLSGSRFFHTYFAKYLKYQEEYTSAQLKTKRISKLLNGTNYTGTTFNGSNSYHFILIDGSMITFNLNSSAEKGLWVAIDVNGLKMPNTIGKDTFIFFISADYGLIPLGEEGTPTAWKFGTYSREKVGPKGTSGLSCSLTHNGYWCAALIMHDGWQMGSDYPW